MTPDLKDSMGLTSQQRMFAWVALIAGAIALIWGLMRDPGTTSVQVGPAATEQPAAAANVAKP